TGCCPIVYHRIVYHRAAASQGFGSDARGILVVRAQLHFRPPGDAPQLTFIGTAHPIQAGPGFMSFYV
ncbi:hypothetical protein LXP63_20510, partial [Yersinia pestis subsp. pestis]